MSLRSLRPACFLLPTLVVAGLFGFTRPALAQVDPFAPPGFQRIQIETSDDAVVRTLDAAGFRLEERTRTHVLLLASDTDLARLEEMGLSWSPFVEEIDTRVFTTYTAMTAELEQLALDHPARARLVSYGRSVQGREMWALEVTSNPDIEEFEPEVRIVGAHHGNEKMATEICMNLAHLLLEGYGSDPAITTLVDTREVWIVPMVNPDGFTANSRYNAHSIDLNRNYGYMWENEGPEAFSEPETRAMRDLAVDNSFSLSLSFHTSGDIVNSVWNYTPDYTADDEVVWRLTEDYAAFNGYWAVRGWYWYETHGDCNDWSYGARGDIDWTIETASSNETAVWNANRDAILHIIDAAGWGIHGQVRDLVTGEPLRARVFIDGNEWPAHTDPVAGDFHKTLLGGTYDVRICANGYQDALLFGVVVPEDGSVILDVALQPGSGRYADRVEQANCPDPSSLYQNATVSMAMLGAPDGVGYAIGRGGDVVLDLGPDSALQDGAGDDLLVLESDEDAIVERCDVYVGNEPFGPWVFLGVAEGTSSFDLLGTGLAEARFVRIEDDGDGSYNGSYPGYELDAIESTGLDPTSVDDGSGGTADLADLGSALRSLAPNPVHSGGSFELRTGRLAELSSTLELLDVSGRVVRVLEPRGAIAAKRSWQAVDESGHPLTPGVYLLRLVTDAGSRGRKLVVVE